MLDDPVNHGARFSLPWEDVPFLTRCRRNLPRLFSSRILVSSLSRVSSWCRWLHVWRFVVGRFLAAEPAAAIAFMGRLVIGRLVVGRLLVVPVFASDSP